MVKLKPPPCATGEESTMGLKTQSTCPLAPLGLRDTDTPALLCHLTAAWSSPHGADAMLGLGADTQLVRVTVHPGPEPSPALRRPLPALYSTCHRNLPGPNVSNAPQAQPQEQCPFQHGTARNPEHPGNGQGAVEMPTVASRAVLAPAAGALQGMYPWPSRPGSS